MELLQTSDHESATASLRLVREGAPIDEVLGQAKHYLDRTSTTATSQEDLKASQARQGALSITALCDIPTIQVPAQPWTTKIADDDLVSHLVSLYFTWQNTYFACIDENAFTEAMQSNDTSSTTCSPCLVNAVLFMGRVS